MPEGIDNQKPQKHKGHIAKKIIILGLIALTLFYLITTYSTQGAGDVNGNCFIGSQTVPCSQALSAIFGPIIAFFFLVALLIWAHYAFTQADQGVVGQGMIAPEFNLVDGEKVISQYYNVSYPIGKDPVWITNKRVVSRWSVKAGFYVFAININRISTVEIYQDFTDKLLKSFSLKIMPKEPGDFKTIKSLGFPDASFVSYIRILHKDNDTIKKAKEDLQKVM
jgi:hypothetical protein